MASSSGRIDRENRTVAAMIRLYCRGQHGTGVGLCDQCGSLHEYATLRLDKCPFGDEKSACSKCPVHCYKRAMREEIRRVMRYSGARMLFAHPILAIQHLLDGRKQPASVPRDRERETSDE